MKNLLEMSRPSKSDLPTIYCDMDQVLCNFLNGADKAVGGLFIHAQKDTRWEKIGVYEKLRQKTGREPFTLHDGPPYANGHLHIGHALNKVLKDMVVRSQQMMGKNARYIPGWDCHGLPIEWKIEEKYRQRGRDKNNIPVLDFRKECRKFAEGWIDVQREEFKRLGITGAWDNPYLTMDYHAERWIAEEFMKLLMN